MLVDAIRGYIQIASGLSDATAEKAKEVAQGLLSVVGVANPNDVSSQVSGMAEEVLSMAKAQRNNLVELVRAEVTTVLDSSGLAKTADVDVLKSRLAKVASDVEALLSQLPGAQMREDTARFVEERTPAALTAASMRARVRPRRKDDAAPAAPTPGASAAPAKRTGRQSVSKKAAATKTAAKRSGAKQAVAKQAVVKKAGKKAVPSKAAPRKVSATPASAGKKAASRKAAPTKKAVTKKSSATKPASAPATAE